MRVVGFDSVRPPGSSVEPSPGLVAGALLNTRLDVELDQAPLSSALPAIARAARVNLLPIFRVRDDAPGLDRDAPVTLSLSNVTADEAIDAVLTAGTGMIDATWQIRGSIVECGPKAMLAEPTRRETRAYDITDLHFEIPTLSSPHFDPERMQAVRRTKKEISVDFAKMIVNQVEPDAWREPDAPAPEAAPGGNTPSGPLPTPSHNLDPNGTADIFVRGQWASLFIRNDRTLVIVAPDFIHRQINGYPGIVPPEAHSGAPVRPPSPGGVP